MKKAHIFVLLLLLSGCEVRNFDAQAESAVVSEFKWVDHGKLRVYAVPEWSIFFPVSRVIVLLNGGHPSAIYWIQGREAKPQTHLFFNAFALSPSAGMAPGAKDAELLLKGKVREFNEMIGSGLDITANNKFIYANLLSRVLFCGAYPSDKDLSREDFVDPNIRLSSDGGFEVRLFRSFNAGTVSFWQVKVSQNGQVLDWTVKQASRE